MTDSDPYALSEHLSAPQRHDRIRIGGLMRCCTETIADLYPDGLTQVATEGQKLSCKYHSDNPNHQMIFRDGAWEWDRAAAGLTELPDTAAAGLPDDA